MKSWRKILNLYVKDESKAVQVALKHPKAEALFLAWAIYRGYPMLVRSLCDAPAIETKEEAQLVKRLHGGVILTDGGEYLKPLEMAAHDGQYGMFQDLEHRSDVDYHRAMVQACERGCTELINYMLKKSPPVVDLTKFNYVALLDPANRRVHQEVLILLQRHMLSQTTLSSQSVKGV